jgi:hypothetical protein
VGIFSAALMSQLYSVAILQMHIVMTASPSGRLVASNFANGMLMVLEQGEISALLNLARVLGGFSVAYFQVPWAEKRGALQTFGVEAAWAISIHFRSPIFADNLKTNSLVVGLFFLVIPALQLKGSYLRVSGAYICSCCMYALTMIRQ